MFLTKRGQATGEYALVLGTVTVVVGVILTYATRGFSGKVRDATDHMGDSMLDNGYATVTKQYQPYYATNNYDVHQDRAATEDVQEGGKVDRTAIDEHTNRTGDSTQGVDLSADGQWK